MERKQITISELLDTLNALKKYVVSFTDSLKEKYKMTEDPFLRTGRLVPRIGEMVIEGLVVTYRYHGAGCSVDYGGLKLEYDINPVEKTIKFSSWKFQQFLISYLKLEKDSISENDSYEYLRLLEKEGVVSLVEWTMGQYECLMD